MIGDAESQAEHMTVWLDSVSVISMWHGSNGEQNAHTDIQSLTGRHSEACGS